MLAGRIQRQTGRTALAWQVAFGAAAGLILLLATYHRFILPRPASDQPAQPESAGGFFRECLATFAAFFSKQKIVLLLLFLLFYRLGEAQLVKMVQPFLMDPRAAGGLGLTLEQVGFVYSTLGLAMLILGGIAGGVLVSRHGLRAWLWPMVFIMHLPDAVFIYLSRSQPENLSLIAACIAVEQFGYGFGFTAYMLYMIYIARGRHQTAHYAICTGFMALGFMVPGMWSGWLQEQIGYRHFFLWVMLATVPGFILTALIPLDADFGKRGRN
jgi:PAT family beta-lactamase induction signal transducer AmpG